MLDGQRGVRGELFEQPPPGRVRAAAVDRDIDAQHADQGVAAGAAAGTVAMLTVTRAATGSWVPYIPVAPAAGLVLGVAALTAAAVLIPARLMLRREPALS